MTKRTIGLVGDKEREQLRHLQESVRAMHSNAPYQLQEGSKSVTAAL